MTFNDLYFGVGSASVETYMITIIVKPSGKNYVDKFEHLAREWKETRNRYSSGTEMFIHPAYQKIIGMGEKVLPLIFEELSRELDHWFWALKAITQADPVPAEAVGNLVAMRNHWLAWASASNKLKPKI